MQQQGLGYEAFALQQSRLHRQAITASRLSQEQQDYLQQMSASSMEEQARIEASDTLDFDDYLADYLAQ